MVWMLAGFSLQALHSFIYLHKTFCNLVIVRPNPILKGENAEVLRSSRRTVPGYTSNKCWIWNPNWIQLLCPFCYKPSCLFCGFISFLPLIFSIRVMLCPCLQGLILVGCLENTCVLRTPCFSVASLMGRFSPFLLSNHEVEGDKIKAKAPKLWQISNKGNQSCGKMEGGEN